MALVACQCLSPGDLEDDWFTVVRHPVARLLAQLEFSSDSDVNEVLQGLLNGSRPLSDSLVPMKEYVNGPSQIHFVRYESLDSDLAKLLGSHGIPCTDLPTPRPGSSLLLGYAGMSRADNSRKDLNNNANLAGNTLFQALIFDLFWFYWCIYEKKT